MSVNRVTLVGNVGKDPEIRYIDHNVCVASFTLATTERDHTEWHNIVLWRAQAQYAEQHIRKGAHLYLEGRLRTRRWEDAKGVQRSITEIHVDHVELLSQRSKSATTTNPATSTTPPTSVNKTEGKIFNANNLIDDLPF